MTPPELYLDAEGASGSCGGVSEKGGPPACGASAALQASRETELTWEGAGPGVQVLSYYKIFGYPSGLGALLIRKEALPYLRKSYFGGGTVTVSLAEEPFFR